MENQHVGSKTNAKGRARGTRCENDRWVRATLGGDGAAEAMRPVRGYPLRQRNTFFESFL